MSQNDVIIGVAKTLKRKDPLTFVSVEGSLEHATSVSLKTLRTWWSEVRILPGAPYEKCKGRQACLLAFVLSGVW